MPGVTQKNASQADSPYVFGSRTLDGFRLKLEGDLSYVQLQKFWSELSPAARKKLLRIDKQTLLEQARKNLYCSRCNGLLLEGYSQIIVHGKSLQHDDGVNCERRAGNIQNESADRVAEVASLYCQHDTHDPLVHPWGGLVTTRDGMLTLLDCFLQGESLDKLQSVFDSARAREHERELLYPDACGGEGRGWISQGLINYGKGHGLRETCALHTSRLSCATLVDFWSALGKETRYSFLQMNEDDFIERLVYRFDNKNFCRDCRKNVIREFKELKELKRIRRETHCNNWFCVADTAFQYEVSGTSIRADWHQSFCEVADAYHHFECAVGTGEGKSDISGFEDVGMCWKYKVDGLDLDGLTACFITLRAWRLDGRCIELYVKAHALKGQPCVHRRLVVGDGFVTINTGDNIRTFFEHAEDAEEEDDDNSVDSDGNELDGDGSQPQKHAKSPELAREFLSDAATVIFKEQVEKAFREGTARQNAHSIFVSLALKLLEDRIHVACKDIIALQKQIKLLEEEEKEKCDKERRKERRKTKEREKKLRRKEKMKEKENEADNKNIQSGNGHSLTASTNNSSVYGEDESCHASGLVDSIQEKDHTMPAILHSPRILEGEVKSMGKNCLQYSDMVDEVFSGGGNINIVSPEPIILPPGNMKFRKKKNLLDPAPKSYGVCDPVTVDESHDYIEDLYEEVHSHREISSRNVVNGAQRNSRNQFSRASFRTYPPKFNGQKTYGGHHSRSSSRISHSAYRVKANQATALRSSCTANIQTISVGNTSRPLWTDEKFNGRFSSGGRSVSRGNGALLGYTNSVHGEVHTKQVWEPLASRRNCDGSNSNSSKCSDAQKDERNAENSIPKSSTKNQPSDTSQHSIKHCVVDKSNCHGCTNDLKIYSDLPEVGKKTCDREAVSCVASSNDGINCVSDPSLSTSCSDSSTSCLSEGDFSTATSCIQNTESLSTSDSEDASPLQSIGSTLCSKDSIQHSPDVVVDCGVNTGIWDSFETTTSASSVSDNRFPTLQPRQTFVAQQNETISHFTESKFEMDAQKHLDGIYSQTTASSASVLDQCLNRFSAWPPRQTCYAEGNETVSYPTESNFETEPHQHLHAMHNQSFPFPVFPSHNMGYYHTTASWPTLATNALLPFPHSHRHCGLTTNRPYDHHMMSDRMTYGDFHPLAPALNIGQVQFYPFESKGMRSKEYGMASNMRMCGAADSGLLDETGAVKKVNGNFERSFSNHDQISSEASLHLLHGDHRNFPSDGDRVFSLFHFGSKAVGSELKPFSVSSLKNDVIGDIRSHSKFSPPGKADVAQTKKEGIMEEYSLFAPDNSYLHFFN